MDTSSIHDLNSGNRAERGGEYCYGFEIRQCGDPFNQPGVPTEEPQETGILLGKAEKEQIPFADVFPCYSFLFDFQLPAYAGRISGFYQV